MSLARNREPIPLLVLSDAHGRLLVDKCRELLDGVGDPDAGFWHKMSVAVHWRLPLTEAEMALLPDGWLACPAIDTGGCEDIMTKEAPYV